MTGSVGADSSNPMKQQAQQRKKRIVTAARREQNKIAQRTYRDRQKQRKQTSQCNNVIRAPRRLKPRYHSEDLPGKAAPRSLPEESSAFIAPGTGAVSPPMNQTDPTLPCLTPPSSYLKNGYTNFTIPPASNPARYTETEPSSDKHDEEPQAIVTFPAYDATLDVVQPRPAAGAGVGIDLHANILEDTQTTVYLACVQNARCLGLTPYDLGGCHAHGGMSPFFRPTVSIATATALHSHYYDDNTAALLVASAAWRGIPAHLQPTLAQIAIPHHVSLDLIPLPRFRDRAILMAAALPHLFDLWDLKLDIYVRAALVCWRSRRGGTDAFQPWDPRSWEARSWFLRKWAMVINSSSGGGGGDSGAGAGDCELVSSIGGSQEATMML